MFQFETSMLTIRHVQNVYTANILQLLVYTLSKISVCLFISALNSRFDIKVANYVLFGLIAAWGLCSIFIVAFRCSLPTPWNGNESECLGSAFTVSMGINIVNIITDFALVALPTIMMWSVHTTIDVKARVISLFASRLMYTSHTLSRPRPSMLYH